MTEKEFIARIAGVDKEIGAIYDRFVNELAKESLTISDIPSDEVFSFDKYPKQNKRVQEIVTNFSSILYNRMMQWIKQGVNYSFNANTDEIKAFSSYDEKIVRSWRKEAADAFISSRIKSKYGLSLSDKVWNYTSQKKSEFEAAMSDHVSKGIEKGISAEKLGLQLRELLNNPELMYRRYHLKRMTTAGKKDVVEWRKRIIDENGKTRFVKVPYENTGQGVYHSARKNALRLASTEINIAYRFADCFRWSKEPFVRGIRIDLSDNHPLYDICDELCGDYPKWFLWSGWHPKCRCHATPILIGKDEMDMISKLPQKEYMNYKPKDLITEMPENYKKWLDKNAEKILRAEERGTSPYFLRDNYVDGRVGGGLKWEQGTNGARRIKTEAEKEDIQKRWNERRLNNRISRASDKLLQLAKDFPDIDISKLEKLTKERDFSGVKEEMKNVGREVAWYRRNTPKSLYDSTMRSIYGDEAVEALYSNIKRTMGKYDDMPLDERIKKMEFESNWSAEHKKYSTWNEASLIYLRNKKRLEQQGLLENLIKRSDELYSTMEAYGMKRFERTPVLSDLKRVQYDVDNMSSYLFKTEKIKEIYDYGSKTKSATFLKIRDSLDYRIKKNGLDANLDDLFAEAKKNIERLEKERLSRKKTTPVKGNETVEQLVKRLGEKTPETIKNLGKAITDNSIKPNVTAEQ